MVERTPAHMAWKGIIYDYDALSAIDDTQQCAYTLNDRDVALVLAAMDTYGWITRYHSGVGTAILQNVIDEWQGHLNRALMECGAGMTLRQNPTNNCQLQQSSDGGTTWTLAFDYSLCVPPLQQTLILNSINAQFNAWAGMTLTQINYFAPTITFGTATGDTPTMAALRAPALCNASEGAVAAACEAAARGNEGGITLLNIAAAALALAAAITVFILSDGSAVPLYLALAAAAVHLASTIASVSPSAFRDATTQELLACLMSKTLNHSVVTQANFEHSLDVNQSGWTSTQNAVRAAIAAMLQSPADATNIYSAFINILGSEMGAALAGASMPTCPCPAICSFTLTDWSSPLPPEITISGDGVHYGDPTRTFRVGGMVAVNPLGTGDCLKGTVVGGENEASFVLDLGGSCYVSTVDVDFWFLNSFYPFAITVYDEVGVVVAQAIGHYSGGAGHFNPQHLDVYANARIIAVSGGSTSSDPVYIQGIRVA